MAPSHAFAKAKQRPAPNNSLRLFRVRNPRKQRIMKKNCQQPCPHQRGVKHCGPGKVVLLLASKTEQEYPSQKGHTHTMQALGLSLVSSCVVARSQPIYFVCNQPFPQLPCNADGRGSSIAEKVCRFVGVKPCSKWRIFPKSSGLNDLF